ALLAPLLLSVLAPAPTPSSPLSLHDALPILLLPVEAVPQRFAFHVRHHVVDQAARLAGIEQRQDVRVLQVGGHPDLAQEALDSRSEEHTSELQSHLNLVCRLLLEKKKK